MEHINSNLNCRKRPLKKKVHLYLRDDNDCIYVMIMNYTNFIWYLLLDGNQVFQFCQDYLEPMAIKFHISLDLSTSSIFFYFPKYVVPKTHFFYLKIKRKYLKIMFFGHSSLFIIDIAKLEMEGSLNANTRTKHEEIVLKE